MKKEKLKKFIIAVLAFLLMSAGGIVGTVIIDQILLGEIPKPLGVKESLEIILSVERCTKWFLIFEVIALTLAASLIIFESKDYKSKTIKLTDKISIPEPSGEGQHGTARFMTKREFKKRYKSFRISKKISAVKALEHNGKRLKRFIKASCAPDLWLRTLEKRRLPKFVKHPARWGYKVVFPQLQILSERFIRRLGEYVRRLAKNKTEHIENGFEAPSLSDGQLSKLPKGSGLVINREKKLIGEKIYTLSEDVHTLILGSTGAGKTRRMVIPSLCSLALSGESLAVTDPKGEIYAYTCDFLKSLGYKVCVLNFFDMSMSMAFNPLQTVIDAVNEGDMSLAASRAWDITSFLVEKAERSEPIWSNGEMSVIAAAILCVVCDNVNRPHLQNLTNVYSFIANMSKPVPIYTGSRSDDGGMMVKIITPLKEYIKALPDDHPAKPLLGISEIAPDKTAGSFYTSALTTLRLYTAENIYNITKSSEFRLETLGSEKQALFFVLPDSKNTYYPIVSLICSQIYDILTETAKKNGNVLSRRVNYILDEFGNFSKIPDFCTMLTVGRGYGIRFNLFLQSFAQLEQKYEKTGEQIIKNNCVWICLSAGNNESQKDFETRLGHYTVSSHSLSSSEGSKNSSGSRSNSSNLISRELLKSEEVGKIDKPYLLISQSGQYPIITRLPDLSKWRYNKMLGLGSPDYNEEFVKYMTSVHKHREWEKIVYWNIWNLFTEKGVTLNNLSEKLHRAIYGDEENEDSEIGLIPIEAFSRRSPKVGTHDLAKSKENFENEKETHRLREDVDRLISMMKDIQDSFAQDKDKMSEQLRIARDELYTSKKEKTGKILKDEQQTE